MHKFPVEGPDRLPAAQRWLIGLAHGIRASKLILDLEDPSTGASECRFYGYVTRKSALKILIQSDLDISQSEGHVTSGEGLEAALGVLSESLREEDVGQAVRR